MEENSKLQWFSNIIGTTTKNGVVPVATSNDKISRRLNFADDENFQFRVDFISRFRGRRNLSTAKKVFSNRLFSVMKVISYTALKKIEDSIYKQKAAEKSLKPSSRSIKFKRY